ncbi:MAG: hypothetical protein ACI4JJ_05280 [Huintestinicola sp.]
MNCYSELLERICGILGAQNGGFCGVNGSGACFTGETDYIRFLDGTRLESCGIKIICSGKTPSEAYAEMERMLLAAEEYEGDIFFETVSPIREEKRTAGGFLSLEARLRAVYTMGTANEISTVREFFSQPGLCCTSILAADVSDDTDSGFGDFVPLMRGVTALSAEYDPESIRRGYIDGGNAAFHRFGGKLCGGKYTVEIVGIDESVCGFLFDKALSGGKVRFLFADKAFSGGVCTCGYVYLKAAEELTGFRRTKYTFVIERGDHPAESFVFGQ